MKGETSAAEAAGKHGLPVVHAHDAIDPGHAIAQFLAPFNLAPADLLWQVQP